MQSHYGNGLFTCKYFKSRAYTYVYLMGSIGNTFIGEQYESQGLSSRKTKLYWTVV